MKARFKREKEKVLVTLSPGDAIHLLYILDAVHWDGKTRIAKCAEKLFDAVHAVLADNGWDDLPESGDAAHSAEVQFNN